jgi:hypothetical protein
MYVLLFLRFPVDFTEIFFVIIDGERESKLIADLLAAYEQGDQLGSTLTLTGDSYRQRRPTILSK